MILQTRLPYDVTRPRPLPGIQPLGDAPWALVDEAYAGQMALREELLDTSRDDVLALDPDAMPAALELLDTVLAELPEGFARTGARITCPDGRAVAVNRADPLGTLGRLLQEDLCILQKRGDEHVLTGAVLCFPASWTLAEKFRRPLIAIHGPVDSYDGNMARRVQRLFDGIRAGAPLWRFNAIWYRDPDLHHPRSESDPRAPETPDDARYLRSERQVLRRLPQTGAVIFSIHTFVLPANAISDEGQGKQPGAV